MNATLSWHDPVVAEIHAIRERLADQYHNLARLLQGGRGALPGLGAEYGSRPTFAMLPSNEVLQRDMPQATHP